MDDFILTESIGFVNGIVSIDVCTDLRGNEVVIVLRIGKKGSPEYCFLL